jgi:hypothetical protein
MQDEMPDTPIEQPSVGSDALNLSLQKRSSVLSYRHFLNRNLLQPG